MMKEIFSEIYRNNLWGCNESVSGPGSSIRESQKLIDALPQVFSRFDIKSVLDAPCGDYHWMQQVSKNDISYTGVDIVDELIKNNTEKYADQLTVFMVKDIVEDNLPQADLVICRDGLVHLTLVQINKAIANLKNCGCKYLLATHFPAIEKNADINTGDWRPLNLCLEPFNFPQPLLVIEETTAIKTMAMWKFSELKLS